MARRIAELDRTPSSAHFEGAVLHSPFLTSPRSRGWRRSGREKGTAEGREWGTGARVGSGEARVEGVEERGTVPSALLVDQFGSFGRSRLRTRSASVASRTASTMALTPTQASVHVCSETAAKAWPNGIWNSAMPSRPETATLAPQPCFWAQGRSSSTATRTPGMGFPVSAFTMWTLSRPKRRGSYSSFSQVPMSAAILPGGPARRQEWACAQGASIGTGVWARRLLSCYAMRMDLPCRVRASLERAQDDARCGSPILDSDGVPRTRRVAIGDPQAPIEAFLSILDYRGLLGDDGRLSPEVQLVSMGDHFDFGDAQDRESAARSGIMILAWLAAHAPDQTILLLGNHDLGRVGELACFSDEEFETALADAITFYRNDELRKLREPGFLARYPAVPTAELVARDFSGFRAAQRDLVNKLLNAQRFRAAFAAAPDLLLCHAGVTRDDLRGIGVSEDSMAFAPDVATALNERLDAVTKNRVSGPLAIPGLHMPGDAVNGEGRGIFYHRPSNPAHESPTRFQGPPRRRFDPRWLPRGLTQAIGHIRDKKCCALLKEWAVAPGAKVGQLRHLRTDGEHVEYRAGVPTTADPEAATMLFLDGDMLKASAAAYELLDIDARTPVA